MEGGGHEKFSSGTQKNVFGDKCSDTGLTFKFLLCEHFKLCICVCFVLFLALM